MSVARHIRSRCNECDRPAILCDGEAYLCEHCDQRLNGAVETGAAPEALRASDAAGCGLRSKADPQPNRVSFEDEVSALEKQWARDGILILDILNSDGAIGLRGAR